MKNNIMSKQYMNGFVMFIFTVLLVITFLWLMNGNRLDEKLHAIVPGFFGFVITFCVYFTYISFQKNKRGRSVADIVKMTNKKYNAINNEIEKELRDLYMKKNDVKEDKLYDAILTRINDLETLKIKNNNKKIREMEYLFDTV